MSPAGPGPGEAGGHAGLPEDLPAAVRHAAGGARAAPHPRQQQEPQQQATPPHDLRVALPALQGLRGSGLQIQWPPTSGAHHCQIRHTQENRPSGTARLPPGPPPLLPTLRGLAHMYTPPPPTVVASFPVVFPSTIKNARFCRLISAVNSPVTVHSLLLPSYCSALLFLCSLAVKTTKCLLCPPHAPLRIAFLCWLPFCWSVETILEGPSPLLS